MAAIDWTNIMEGLDDEHRQFCVINGKAVANLRRKLPIGFKTQRQFCTRAPFPLSTLKFIEASGAKYVCRVATARELVGAFKRLAETKHGERFYIEIMVEGPQYDHPGFKRSVSGDLPLDRRRILETISTALNIPIDALAKWQQHGEVEGKRGHLAVSYRAGRLIALGRICAADPNEVAIDGYLGCTLWIGAKTYDLPALRIHGYFDEFFDVSEYGLAKFSLGLWARKVHGNTSYDRKNGYHMEGRIATVIGEISF